MLRFYQKRKFDADNDKQIAGKVNYFTESPFYQHKIIRVFVIPQESKQFIQRVPETQLLLIAVTVLFLIKARISVC